MCPLPPQEQHENIVLDYKCIILIPRFDLKLFADRAEFFTDEHGFQWVKFVPTNGYDKGKEHCKRTEDIIFVRNDEYRIEAKLGEPRPVGRQS